MKATFLLSLIFSSFFIQAQEAKKIIIDSKTNKPIPFATIKVPGKPNGVIATESGEFAISIDPEDSILITCVGYKSKLISGKDIRAIIYLEPKEKILEAIIARPTKFLRSLLVGFDTSKLKADLNWGPGGRIEFAQRMNLPDSSRLYKLKTVFIRIKIHRCYGPLLLHIYATDTLTGNPGEEILTKQVYFNKSSVKKSKATIDMDSDNIYWQSTKSFFLSFSWLPEATAQQCLTTIFFMPSPDSNTFFRTILSNSYNWSPFYWGKDQAGNPSHATTFFSAEVDELN